MSTHDIDEAIFHVASALEIPVLILALAALALVIFELGSYAIELLGRRRRRFDAACRKRRARACLACSPAIGRAQRRS